jgi:hypothetical protein
MRKLLTFIKRLFKRQTKVSSDYLFEYDKNGNPIMSKKHTQYKDYQQDTKDI